MITIENLTVKFNHFTAVNQLNLHIKRGELFGFLGPNGAGKTTTIRVLNGALKPNAGRVRIAGFDIAQQLQAIKTIVGYVCDTENHYEELTGRENLTLFANLYGVSTDAVATWLARLQLTEAADVKVRGYSKGMKKKLLIARELLHQPQLIFFDEPTANLDAHSIALVRKLMRDLVNDGATVFLTTHDMEEVEAICDRVAILAKGKLLECDTPTAFITRHAERFCDVQYDQNGVTHRKSFHLDLVEDRQTLAEIIQTEHCVRVHSREFKFEDVFKKLTGEVYK